MGKILNMVIEGQDRQRLDQLAKAAGVPRAEVVRRLIRGARVEVKPIIVVEQDAVLATSR